MQQLYSAQVCITYLLRLKSHPCSKCLMQLGTLTHIRNTPVNGIGVVPDFMGLVT